MFFTESYLAPSKTYRKQYVNTPYGSLRAAGFITLAYSLLHLIFISEIWHHFISFKPEKL